MNHKILIVFLVLATLISCKNAGEDIQVNNINSSWKKNNSLNFEFNISDAQQAKNIIFVVRNNNDYPYSNLRLFVTMSNEKTKKSVTDTLNFVMAKPSGEWLGKGFGETKEITFPYKTNYKFPGNGKYKFAVKQAMRENDLKGLEDLGIKIENQSL